MTEQSITVPETFHGRLQSISAPFASNFSINHGHENMILQVDLSSRDVVVSFPKLITGMNVTLVVVSEGNSLRFVGSASSRITFGLNHGDQMQYGISTVAKGPANPPVGSTYACHCDGASWLVWGTGYDTTLVSLTGSSDLSPSNNSLLHALAASETNVTLTLPAPFAGGQFDVVVTSCQGEHATLGLLCTEAAVNKNILKVNNTPIVSVGQGHDSVMVMRPGMLVRIVSNGLEWFSQSLSA